MKGRLPTTDELRGLVDDVEEALSRGVDEGRAWLVSPQGRRFRVVAARGLALATPVILRHPFFKTPVGRVVQLAGAAAVVAKVADVIRDWEPAVVPGSDPG